MWQKINFKKCPEFFYKAPALVNYYFFRISTIRPNLVIQNHIVDTRRIGSPRYSIWAFKEA